MEYIIYCDESEKTGEHCGNFYGGVLIRSKDYIPVRDALIRKKNEIGMFESEAKWTKITPKYQDKYIALMDEFFNLVADDKVKVRIMFTHNRFQKKLTKEQRDNEYFLLYYQFLKHAFGLKYSNPNRDPIGLRIFFDQFPDNSAKAKKFIDYIYNLQFQSEFMWANIYIKKDHLTEVCSHKHVLLQCLDVVLGSIEFRLNRKDQKMPEGKSRRAKRTIAKEKVYKHINKRIRDIMPGFNIGMSTGKEKEEDLWEHPYRHWLIRQKGAKINVNYKPKNK